ncbi:MAG: class I SAM-dependent methyltransferase [Polyangiaceae bacterium]
MGVGAVGSPQSFWLEQLERGSRYSNWVFGEAKPYLGASILEVGCGCGTYTTHFAKLAQRVVALDIDQDFVAAAKLVTSGMANVEVRCADATKEHFEQGFDSAVMLDVLEHIEGEQEMLAKLRDVLKPGGHIVVKVPAFSWLFGAMDRAVGHHRRYTRSTLAKALTDAGFQDPKTWYFNAASIPGWWLNGVVLRRETPPSGQLSLFDRLLPVIRSVDRLAKPFVGLSIFGVARR